MDKFKYLELIAQRYEKNFQVKKNESILYKTFDIYAKYTESTGRTFITESDIVDRFEVNEHCFIKTFTCLNIDITNEFTEYLKNLTEVFVKPHREHRSTIITGVIVSEDSINEDIIKLIKKFKYTKYYKFYLQGCSDIRLIAVDLKNNKIFSNKIGRSVEKVYFPLY